MNDPFAPPLTARDEMAQRIEVLRKQAARDQEEAEQHRKRADELDAQAEQRLSVAAEYEAIAEKAARR